MDSIDFIIKNNIDLIKFYNQLITDKILKKMQVENGVITRVNGDSRYAVRISGRSISFPNIVCADNTQDYKVGDNVLVQFPFGNLQLPRIIGYSDLALGVQIVHTFTELPYTPPPPPPCFIARTKILTSKGKVNIEDIKINDYVLGCNEKSKIIVLNKVVKLLIHNKLNELSSSYYNIKSEKYGGYECETNVTRNHPFYIGDSRYENIENVNINQGLYCFNYRNYNGNIKKIKLIKKKLINLDTPIVTYNLELNNDGTHNYFADNFMVHNATIK